MKEKQSTDEVTAPTPTTPGTAKPRIWERVDDGIWEHLPSGIYYERPKIDEVPTYRSLRTRDLGEARKEFYRRRARGDAAYKKPEAITVGEVILNYTEAGCPDRSPALNVYQTRPIGGARAQPATLPL